MKKSISSGKWREHGMVKLILRYHLGDESWQEAELAPGETRLGRGQDCTILLDHPKVSRNHATILLENDQLWLTDLGSANGTVLEGNRLPANQRIELQPGQTFSIGGFVLEIITRTIPIEPAIPSRPEAPATVFEQSSKPIASQFKLRFKQTGEDWKEAVLYEGIFQ